jgi:methionyl-tRNA synthetase
VPKEKILVTSALPYVNGPIHLGHLSGAYLPADIYVRYKRLKGDDIIYICGSDEHGVPITLSADKEGVSPKKIIDRYHNINRQAFEKFGMSFNNYSRTEKAKMFLPDRYVEGTCPNCGFEEARSDECENCGALYEPSELIDPKSKITGETPVFKETSHWFFPLGKYQKRLEEYINEMNEKYDWKENVLQYCRAWFKVGLKDRAVTRDLDWGVKVPLDSAEGKVIYVWFEAVLGYISSTKEYAHYKGDEDLWKKYWQDVNTKYVAFIGKDNVVFHCIIFPAMLMVWNDGENKEKYCLPQNVPANEFLNFEGKKFSKSRNWGIDAIDFLKIFPSDPLRYTLAANAPENRDTDFYWKEFQARNNNELADILGNFVNRTFTFVHKHFDGKVPERNDLKEIDNEMIKTLSAYPQKISSYFEKYKFKDGTNELMNLARAGNKYFNDSEPWKTIKENKQACANTINICLQAIYTLAELFEPVIPYSSNKLFKMLNTKPVEWGKCGNDNMPIGHILNEVEILFPKFKDDVIEKQINDLGKTVNVNLPKDELISYDDFMKTQLKVAEVFAVEKIEKSKKLLKLLVKLDDGERQLVAGVAEHYAPEDLIGKKVVVVSNLQPAKLMGHESKGMILAVEKENGELEVITVDSSVKNGTRVK